jgi:predicted HicB family RNase H-like nuclease
MKEKIILIRVPEELHYKVKLRATAERKTLKQYIIDTLQQAVERGGESGMPTQGRARKKGR